MHLSQILVVIPLILPCSSVALAGSPPVSSSFASFNPYNPPTVAEIKARRTLTSDYTFGTTATSLKVGAVPISNMTQLNNLFWNLIAVTNPAYATNGNWTRYPAGREWQNFVGTNNLSFGTDHLQIQATLAADVTTDASLASNIQAAANKVVVSGTGTHNFTIGTGLAWQPGDLAALDNATNASAPSAVGQGTIISYNSSTGALVLKLTAIYANDASSAWAITRLSISSGMLRSKATFLYGFYEIYAQVPRGDGLMGSGWLAAASSAKPGRGEIDFFEQSGGNPARGINGYRFLGGASHISSGSARCYYNARQITGSEYGDGTPWLYEQSADLTAGYHKYGALWIPGYFAVYLDDVPIGVCDQPWEANDGTLLPNGEIFVQLTAGVGGIDWSGIPDDINAFPANYNLQYIRVWQSADEMKAQVNNPPAVNLVHGGDAFAATSGGAGWTMTGGTIAAFAATAPDGSHDAAVFTEDGSTGFHKLTQYLDLIALGSATFSVYVKAGAHLGRGLMLAFNDQTYSNRVRIAVDPVTGNLLPNGDNYGYPRTAASATISSIKVSPADDGWYQLAVTFNFNSIYSWIEADIMLTESVSGPYPISPWYTGNGSNVLLWRPSLIRPVQ
jgi:beta-glucanase (GH16 family)